MKYRNNILLNMFQFRAEKSIRQNKSKISEKSLKPLNFDIRF